MTMAPSQLGAFTRSRSGAQDRANIEYHVQPLSLDKFGEPLHPFPAFTASVCNLRPTSRGASRCRSRRSGAGAGDPRRTTSAPTEDRRVAADCDPRHARASCAQPALREVSGRRSI